MNNRWLVLFKKLHIAKLLIVAGYVLLFALIFYSPLLKDYLTDDQYLNVLVFAETFSPESIQRFEQETGVRVNITYAETDEQVYAKFKINKGEGYDVVNISDYMVDLLAQQDLLYPINLPSLKNSSFLDSRILNRNYDPDNQFSVPHKWYVYGLAYDKDFFQMLPEDMSLRFIFTNPVELVDAGEVLDPYKVSMIDDGRDAIFLTSLFLYGSIDTLSQQKFLEIQAKLIEQKKWIEVYTVHSASYFLLGNITPIALMSSNYMKKILDMTQRFAFAIPHEGGLLVIENMAIPKQSKKVMLARQFIDFMISEDISRKNSLMYGYNSANKIVFDESARQSELRDKNLYPDDETFNRLFIPLLPLHQRKIVEDVWLAVGFA